MAEYDPKNFWQSFSRRSGFELSKTIPILYGPLLVQKKAITQGASFFNLMQHPRDQCGIEIINV